MKLFTTLSAAWALFLLLPACALGQQNFQPAKVTTLAGDTLRGFINYRGWDRNPRTVSFKPDLQAPEQQFRPLDIKGFSVSSEQYAGARVSVENSPQELNDLSSTATPSYRADTVFLRALVAGPKSLYEYKDANGYNFFYTKQGGSYDLLVFKRYKAPGYRSEVVQLNTTFRDQLAGYLADCPGIEPKLKAIGYTANALQRTFAGYYACTRQPLAFQRRSTIKQQFGVLGGVCLTNVVFSDVKNPEYPTFDSYTQIRPTGGIYYNVSLPGSLGRFSVSNALVFNSFSASGYHEEISPYGNTHRKTSSSLALSYLKLHSLLRISQPLGVGAIFINAGVSNGYAIQIKSEKTVREKFYSTETTTTSELFSSFRRYEQCLVAGIGASYKRLSAEGRFEYSNGFLPYKGFSAGFDRYELLLGYRLH
ncbi:hypothetical protein GCM10022409_49280 [Hymenobacter glaciei]|uniref:Outer membrane protein beta-barrel domain-containing protein n=1 Tax=Hymenobacter glaciei TaxID=877209 RepID=A0ABP7UZF3_9BACT